MILSLVLKSFHGVNLPGRLINRPDYDEARPPNIARYLKMLQNDPMRFQDAISTLTCSPVGVPPRLQGRAEESDEREESAGGREGDRRELLLKVAGAVKERWV